MDSFELDGITFVQDLRPGVQRGVSSKDEFILVKNRTMLEFYEELAARKPKNIVEIGMFEGGSMVYFDKLFKPDNLVGIDIKRKPIEPLEQYRIGREHIKTFYGRSQDALSTRGAVQANCKGGVDLVVDDASHLYELTKTTFENLFPLVKSGGTYVIEDWAWSHRPAAQAPDAAWSQQPALSNLIISLVLMTGVSHVIERVLVTEHLVAVTKGKGVLPATKLDVSHSLRGKSLTLL